MDSPRDASMAGLLSEDQRVALAEALGGTRIYLPKRVKPSHPIAAAIGVEAATSLVDTLGCGIITVPLWRELRARRYRSAGLTRAQIARKLGMTVEGVARLLHRHQHTGIISPG